MSLNKKNAKHKFLNQVDIRPIKKALRKEFKSKRQALAFETPELKKEFDQLIHEKLVKLDEFKNSENILIYVSTDIEVDTTELIALCFEMGKNVYVPYCITDTLDIEFYKITSFDELSNGTFGVLEPKPVPKNLYTSEHDESALCIIPALCYDHEGFRLGYGKGYYDRFLSNFRGHMVGICYNNCIKEKLPHGRYDCAVHKVITEQAVFNL